jgi:hypothetical protein
MSRGYFTLAQGQVYQRAAYAAALSLKLSQPTGYEALSIGVTPEERAQLPAHYLEVFDEVVDIPWGDSAERSIWKLENEWKAIYMSPYDETIKIDADMLFPQDISSWWDVLTESEGCFATSVRTYRGAVADDAFCRKTFIDSNLPNVYTAFFFFKKSPLNYELFKTAELIFNNWERFFYEFLEAESRPRFVSTDVVFALAAKLTGYLELNKYPHVDAPTFIHMKSRLQDWPLPEAGVEQWTTTVPVYYSKDCDLKIGNFRQTLPLHYHDRQFLTDEIISTMEKKLGIAP